MTWMASSPTRGRRSGRMPVCHCEQCRKLPTPGQLAYWERFNERDRCSCGSCTTPSPRRRSRRNFFFANLGGGIRSTANLVQLGEAVRVVPVRQPGSRRRRHAHLGMRAAGSRLQRRAEGQDDHQRHRRLVHRRPVRWRNVYKSPEEAQMWMDETLASGMVPYHHIIGGENGWAKIAAGWSPRASTSTGWRSTTGTSSTSARSPTSAW